MTCIVCTKPLTADQIIARLVNVKNRTSKHGPYCSCRCHQADRSRRIQEAKAAALWLDRAADDFTYGAP